MRRITTVKLYLKYAIYMTCAATIILVGCTNKKKVILDETDITYIPIEDIQESLDLDSRVAAMSFVTLEDSVPEALFKRIDKCIFQNDRIYILDYFGTSSVKVFDLKGRFLFNVGTQGIGPKEYHKVVDFDVTSDGIYLLDSKLRKILNFNLDGSFKDEYSYDDTMAGINGFIVTSDGNFLLGMDISINSKEQVLLTDKEFSVSKVLLSFDPMATKGHLNIGSFRRCGKQIIYNHPVSDDIYVFNDKGDITYKYVVSLGGKGIPKDIIHDYQEISKAKKQGQSLSYFYEVPLLAGNLLVATMYYNSNKAMLCLDLKEKRMLLNEYKVAELSFSLSDFNFPIYADECQVVCLVDRMTYEYWDEASKQKINKKALKYLDEGGSLLIVYRLNV